MVRELYDPLSSYNFKKSSEITMEEKLKKLKRDYNNLIVQHESHNTRNIRNTNACHQLQVKIYCNQQQIFIRMNMTKQNQTLVLHALKIQTFATNCQNNSLK